MKKKNNSRCIFKAIILWLTCLYCISDALVSEKLLLCLLVYSWGKKPMLPHLGKAHLPYYNCQYKEIVLLHVYVPCKDVGERIMNTYGAYMMCLHLPV